MLCLFGLMLNVPVNSYGHVRMVSSPNNTFSWASLTKQLTSTSCAYFYLLVTLESVKGRRMTEELMHDQSTQMYGIGPGLNS